MRAHLQRAALRATARIAFGSSARALLGSGALGLGLSGCGGMAIGEEPGTTSRPPASSGASGDGAGASQSNDGGGAASQGSRGGANGNGPGGTSGGGRNEGALATAGSGGGGASSGGSASGSAGLSGEASGGAASGGSPGSDPEPACVGPTVLTHPSVPPGPTEQEFSCCLAQVSSAANGLTEERFELLSSEPIVNCCRAIVTAVDLDGTRYQAASRVRTPCCSDSVGERVELYAHVLCTPWGPPMPPALDWRAA